MTTINGMPAHALLLHVVVVLAPLTALLLIACALWPPARRRLVWLNLALTVAVLVLTPLTTKTGEWLYNQRSEHSAILQTHAQRAEWAKYIAIALFVVAVLQVFQHWRESRSSEPKRALALAAGVLALVVGVASIVGVMMIGDAGAQSVWGGRY